jgi:hypothetical protein
MDAANDNKFLRLVYDSGYEPEEYMRVKKDFVMDVALYIWATYMTKQDTDDLAYIARVLSRNKYPEITVWNLQIAACEWLASVPRDIKPKLIQLFKQFAS